MHVPPPLLFSGNRSTGVVPGHNGACGMLEFMANGVLLDVLMEGGSGRHALLWCLDRTAIVYPPACDRPPL